MISLQAFLFILLLSSLSLSSAKLLIKAPSNPKEEKLFNQVDGLDYVVLNKRSFSSPYLGALTGRLIFDPKNEYGCYAPDIRISFDPGTFRILVAAWGECHYSEKIKSAKYYDVKMLILVLGEDMTFNHSSIHQLAMTTEIEVLVILKKDGDKLMKDSRYSLEYSDAPERYIMNVKPEGGVVLDFWITPNDISPMYDGFLEGIRDIVFEFGTDLEFYPRYVLSEYASAANGELIRHERCVSGGRYCDLEDNIKNILYGREAVLEALKHICIREMDDLTNSDAYWWKYIRGWSPPSESDHCMKTSFGVSTNEALRTTFNDNPKLKAELDAKKEMQVKDHPALYVNKEKYKGSLSDRIQLKAFICSHFNKKALHPICNPNPKVVSTWGDILTYMGYFLGFAAVVFYCVRRNSKRKAMFELKEEDEVPQSVNRYQGEYEGVPDEIFNQYQEIPDVIANQNQVPNETSDSTDNHYVNLENQKVEMKHVANK